MIASSSPVMRLEQPAVGVEAGGIEDRVLGAEEGREPALEFAVHGLRAADEAHRGHAVAVAVERGVRGRDDRGVIREAEVVVGAEVQDLAPVLEPDHGILRRGDHALALEEPGACELRRLRFEPIEQGLVHGIAIPCQRRIIPAVRASPRIIAAGRKHESSGTCRPDRRGAGGSRGRDRRLARGATVPRAGRPLHHQRPDRRVRRRQDLRARGHARHRAVRLAPVRAERLAVVHRGRDALAGRVHHDRRHQRALRRARRAAHLLARRGFHHLRLPVRLPRDRAGAGRRGGSRSAPSAASRTCRPPSQRSSARGCGRSAAR